MFSTLSASEDVFRENQNKGITGLFRFNKGKQSAKAYMNKHKQNKVY